MGQLGDAGTQVRADDDFGGRSGEGEGQQDRQ